MNSRRMIGAAIVGTAALVLSVSCSATGASTAAPNTAKPDTSWAPADYTVYSFAPTMAWKWTPDSQMPMCNHGGCAGIQVMSKDGCPGGVYIEISLLDGDDVSLGKMNDITGALPPMGSAKAVLEAPRGGAEDAEAWRVEQTTCF